MLCALQAGSPPDVWLKLLEQCAAEPSCQPTVLCSLARQLAEQQATAAQQLADVKTAAAQQLAEQRATTAQQLAEYKETAAQQLVEHQKLTAQQLADHRATTVQQLAELRELVKQQQLQIATQQQAPAGRNTAADVCTAAGASRVECAGGQGSGNLSELVVHSIGR